MTDLNPNPAVRMETAHSDFVRGVVRPDAPGMVYYPSIPELCKTYDLDESVMTAKARSDGWLEDRKKAMATSLVTPFSAAVDANPDIVKRSVAVVQKMEDFDDKVFNLADRAMVIAEKAMTELEHEDDPIRAIRALRSLAQTMESFHRTAKTAYDPASIRPDNTVNILNVQSSEDVVLEVTKILAKAKADAIASGVDPAEIEEAEIIEEDDHGS
jgi:hypothetical protein